MSLNFYKGKIAEIGQGVSNGVRTTLSYIQFADGNIVKQISAVPTMNSKLSFALTDGEEIEIFTVKLPNELIIGIKTEDGKVFLAQGITSNSIRRNAQITHIGSFCFMIAGVPLIGYMGVGFLLMYVGYRSKLTVNYPARRIVWDAIDELTAQYPQAIVL